ncbi:MAG: hypothetical protein KGH58_04190 [Candidatus Micrarchaeota archaeon]|nr:hypothetical protein [Candidatus Micrarchaeota archaeon]
MDTIKRSCTTVKNMSRMNGGHVAGQRGYEHGLGVDKNSRLIRGEPRDLAESAPAAKVEDMAIIISSLYTSGILPRSSGHKSAPAGK